jgi:type IV pilus assembly protein PilX
MNSSKHLKQRKFFNQQQGAALVVSLIILVAITMLAVTSMKISSTEQAMAGNLRESALTFQAAEAGLSVAEAALVAGNEPANLIPETNPDPDYMAQATWTGASATEAPVTLINISTNPRYIIKSLGVWNPNASVSALDPGYAGYGRSSDARTIAYYRVTARGSGQTGNTFRTVQTYYGR